MFKSKMLFIILSLIKSTLLETLSPIIFNSFHKLWELYGLKILLKILLTLIISHYHINQELLLLKCLRPDKLIPGI